MRKALPANVLQFSYVFSTTVFFIASCPIAPRYPEFRETLHPCLPSYGFSVEDQTRYSMPKWREIPANETTFLSEFALRQMCPRPWRYYKAGELNNLPFQVSTTSVVQCSLLTVDMYYSKTRDQKGLF